MNNPNAQPTTLSVTLEATVGTAAWLATYGTNAADDLPDHLAHYAMYAPRLVALTPPGTEAATVRLTARHLLTPHAPGYTRVLVVLDVTVDTDRWLATYGTDPQRAIGAHIAAELVTTSPMRDEINGSILYLPQHP